MVDLVPKVALRGVQARRGRHVQVQDQRLVRVRLVGRPGAPRSHRLPRGGKRRPPARHERGQLHLGRPVHMHRVFRRLTTEEEEEEGGGGGGGEEGEGEREKRGERRRKKRKKEEKGRRRKGRTRRRKRKVKSPKTDSTRKQDDLCWFHCK